MAEGYFLDLEKRRLADAAATAEQLAKLGTRHDIEAAACIKSLEALAPPELDPLGAALAPAVVDVRAACEAKVKAGEAHLARYTEPVLADVQNLTRAQGESLTALAASLLKDCTGWQTDHLACDSSSAAEAYESPQLKSVLAAAERATKAYRAKMAAVLAADTLRQHLAATADVFSAPIAAMAAVGDALRAAEATCKRHLIELQRVQDATAAALAAQRAEHASGKQGLETDLKRMKSDLEDLVRRMEDTVTKIAAKVAAISNVDAAAARVEAECARVRTQLDATCAVAVSQREGADAGRATLTTQAADSAGRATAAEAAVVRVREAVKMATREVHAVAANTLAAAATTGLCPKPMLDQIRTVTRDLSAVADAKCEACACCPTCRPDEPAACARCRGCAVCAADGLKPDAAIAGFDPLNPQSHKPVPADPEALVRRAQEVMMRGCERIEASALEDEATAAADAAAEAVKGMASRLSKLVVKRKVPLPPPLLATELTADAAAVEQHTAAIAAVLAKPLARRRLRSHLLLQMAHDADGSPDTAAAAVAELRTLLGRKVVPEAVDAWGANVAGREALLERLERLGDVMRPDEPAAPAQREAKALRPPTLVWVKSADGGVDRFMLRDAAGALTPHVDV